MCLYAVRLLEGNRFWLLLELIRVEVLLALAQLAGLRLSMLSALA